MYKVLLLLRKEWIEVRHQRILWLSMLIPALVFVFAAINAVSPAGMENVKGLPASVSANSALVGMTKPEVMQTAIGQLFRMFFLLLPVFSSSILAAYSIVGEKTNRTLEPLLAAPIRVSELLLAKSLAALIPAVIVTWVAGGVFAVAVASLALSPAVFSSVITVGWLLVLLLSSPLMSLIGIAVTVFVSSRVNDPRTVQTITTLVLMPVSFVVIYQVFGALTLSPPVALALDAALALLAAAAIWGATKLFQRGVILTRWA